MIVTQKERKKEKKGKQNFKSFKNKTKLAGENSVYGIAPSEKTENP